LGTGFLNTDSALDLQKLSPLALGTRATEVLYWLAKGKTNEEIGIILGMATGTVKVHLKNIFFHLQDSSLVNANLFCPF
jgi:DNA-binding NarL/FixJ family response regulator